MQWDDLRYFLALARAGNMRAAAASLGVSHSTVARRIQMMEERLSTHLFERLPEGYELSAAGEDMIRVAERVEDEMGNLERRIAGHDTRPSGVIRVTMADALATHALMPALTAFSRQYPSIELDILASYQVADLDRREADVALRFSASPPDHLVGRRLVSCAMAAYASPDYLADHDPADPEAAGWIAFTASRRFPDWVRDSPFPHLPAHGRIENLLVQISACEEGLGLAWLPCFVGDTAPGLRRVSEPRSESRMDLWLLTHGDVRRSARVRLFTSHIAQAIVDLRPLFEGRSPGQMDAGRSS